MKIAKVTTKGRISIPSEIRKKHQLYTGRKVGFEISENRLLIFPLASAEEIRANNGSLGLTGKMLKSLREEKIRERQL